MNESQARQSVTITNPQGLHARPAQMFVKLANQFEGQVIVHKDHEQADGKSILEILSLAAMEGTELSIEVVGPQADAALTALVELVHNNFYEDNGTVDEAAGGPSPPK